MKTIKLAQGSTTREVVEPSDSDTGDEIASDIRGRKAFGQLFEHVQVDRRLGAWAALNAVAAPDTMEKPRSVVDIILEEDCPLDVGTQSDVMKEIWRHQSKLKHYGANKRPLRVGGGGRRRTNEFRQFSTSS